MLSGDRGDRGLPSLDVGRARFAALMVPARIAQYGQVTCPVSARNRRYPVRSIITEPIVVGWSV
jgi:hypothetical protein